LASAHLLIAVAKRRAALGFKAHTGWAWVVAVALGEGGAEVLIKRRIEMAAGFDEAGVYHASEEMPIEQARAVIDAARAKFERSASEEIASLVAELEASKNPVSAAAIVSGSSKPLPPLESVLKSHALIHAAEGELFRAVLAGASERCRLRVERVAAKELVGRASSLLQLSAAELDHYLAKLGKSSGRPWAIDHRESALAALVVLHSRGKR
jgi:hypothetical protein